MIYPSTALYPSGTVYPEFGPNIIVTNDENAILFIPQFTFVDDAVTIPFKNVESSDSAILSESIAPFVFEPRIDSLVFADAITLSVDLTLFDSATVTDQFESITFEQIDSASITDLIGPVSVSGPQDNIFVEEAISTSLESLDSSSVQDTAEIGIFIEDSISVSDAVNFISFTQSDQLTTTDSLVAISTFVSTFDLDQTYIDFSGFVTADPPGFDHMHWNDEFDNQLIQVSLSSEDDPIVTELTPNIAIPVIELITISEFIELSLIGSDNLAAVDILDSLIVAIYSEDQFVYQELFELTTDTNVADSATLSDAKELNVNGFGTQNITFGENVSITVSVADSGNLTEIVANAVAQSDSLNFVENRNISLTQSDMALFAELSSINTTANKTDSFVFTERDKLIELAGNQLSHLLEKPYYQADYARLDYLFLISEIASASILKDSFDEFAVTELTSNIILNSLQLITFKERTGIGKAAPLVINLNDDPTIHGTVTGDIIDISIGGTEPVLL